MAARTDFDTLVNAPVSLTVGGVSGKETQKDVEIREPSNAQLGRHLALYQGAISELVLHNLPILEAAYRDPESFDASAALHFAGLFEVSRNVIADLVGEDRDFVDNEMTARQATAVIDVYLDLIGWDFIRETFSRALQSWKAAAAKVIKKDAPVEPVTPWSVGHTSQ